MFHKHTDKSLDPPAQHLHKDRNGHEYLVASRVNVDGERKTAGAKLLASLGQKISSGLSEAPYPKK